jgi:hypothetical protein
VRRTNSVAALQNVHRVSPILKGRVAPSYDEYQSLVCPALQSSAPPKCCAPLPMPASGKLHRSVAIACECPVRAVCRLGLFGYQGRKPEVRFRRSIFCKADVGATNPIAEPITMTGSRPWTTDRSLMNNKLAEQEPINFNTKSIPVSKLTHTIDKINLAVTQNYILHDLAFKITVTTGTDSARC